MRHPKNDNNKGKVCSIRMDESTLTRLESYCNLMNIAKSEPIRETIKKMIDETPIVIDGGKL